MQYPEVHKINTTVSIASLRTFIQLESLSDKDVIFLHQRDMDSIALQYRNKHNAAFTYNINKIQIHEDTFKKVHVGEIGTIRDYIIPDESQQTSTKYK